MDDPIQRHPTRAEQLDILAEIVADATANGEAVLDLGCGRGYVAGLLLERHDGLRLAGIDRSAAALDDARDNLARFADRLSLIEGDLEQLAEIELPNQTAFRVILSALTFHDLPDDAKRAVIGWSADRLTAGGYFVLYDRIRLTEAAAFPLQRSIWRRIERVHGTGMRTADTFDDYQADLGTDNRPAGLKDYFEWFAAAGLAPACLHLHGNVALLAGAKPN